MTYSAPPGGAPDPFIIHTQGRNVLGNLAIGLGGSTLVNTATWPSANLAQFYPFVITGRRTYVRAILALGAVSSGNFDIGVYDLAGTRLFSTGSTVMSGTNIVQSVTINWTFGPGLFHLALAIDNITAQILRDPPTSAVIRCQGAKEMASAFVLPASATLAVLSTTPLPVFGISEKSWV